VQSIMNIGYLAALATLFSWTVSNFALAKMTRMGDPFVLNKAVLFFSFFLLGALVCVVDGLWPWQLFTAPSASNWLWLGISGIIGKSAGDYFGFQAMRILGVRRRTMITSLGPGFTWLFALMILNEKMNWLGMVGMLITMISLLLLINSTSERVEVEKENFGLPLSGMLYGIAAAALTGLAFVLSKMTFLETETNISEFHGTWVRILVAFSTLYFVDLLRNKHLHFIRQFLETKQKSYLMILIVLFGAVLGLSFSLIAIIRINAAVAYTIFSMLPVTVILVSVIFYKKRMTMKSWIFSIFAVSGVIILVWRNVLIRYF
jgi:drug/metabolite transporter (DMT)-like permease